MMDIMNMNLEAGQIVEVTTAPSTPPKKLSVPILGLEKFPTQQEIEGQDVRNRRPVRPIDRQRMRPWLMELLDLGNVFGLRWTNRDQGIFQISWRHASRLGWNLETDGDVFERWARHTGIYKEGDPPEPKRWKANFRCALHSLHDVMELTNAVERRGRNACRTYQFLQNNGAAVLKAKSKERKQKPIEPKTPREVVHVLTYERPIRQPVQIQLPESGGSSDELLSSETESEGSHQDKVIVQRVDPKSGEVAEEEYLLHDHDYSGQQDKTQRTIYLRQGVGSIVLHKEVLNAPQLLEDAKAAEALSNLEQLASAAVDSQEGEGGAIMIDANVLSGTSNKSSPAKSSVSEDDGALNLKKLLPRLRARIKETERGGGILRKRKYLAEDMDALGDQRVLGHNQYRLKKVKSEADGSPPSPVRRRSGSPQKQTKSSSRSKRARKESEGSTSDSTEPLMSSCLLLLEAATRLDKAEKGEGMADKKSTKHGRKGGDRSSHAPAAGKKKRGVRALKLQEEQQEVIEEPVLEDIGETVIAAKQETVIEEQIIYNDDTMQVVYAEDTSGEQAAAESEDPEEQAAFDILRSALENIGSEMEVSTSSDISSSPKELAIMRRKKDSDRSSSSSSYNAFSVSDDQIAVSEASFAKGLFSGSEIVPLIHSSCWERKKPKPIASKDAFYVDVRSSGGKPNASKDAYYVDVRSSGGLLSVKKSDSKPSLGLPSVKKSESKHSLVPPVINPLAFMDLEQRESISQIIISEREQKNKKVKVKYTPRPIAPAPVRVVTSRTAAVPVSSSGQQEADIVNTKQTASGKSFISLGPKGKPIILRSSKDTAASSTSSSPSVHQAGSILPPNVKISTLPIISTLKPIVNIPASAGTVHKKQLASALLTSIAGATQTVTAVDSLRNSSGSQKLMALVSDEPGNDGEGGKTYYIKSSEPATSEETTTTSSGDVMTEDSTSTDNSIVQQEILPEGTISAQVIIDPIKGPYIKLPNSSTTIPLTQDLVLTTTSPTSGTTTSQTFTIHAPFGPGGDQPEIVEAQQYEEEALRETVQLYTVDGCGNVVKTEQEDIGDEQQIVVQHEDGTAYYIPVQGERDSPPPDTAAGDDNNAASNQDDSGNNGSSAVRVEVNTAASGDQTCFISPEQLEQANHIIHISQGEVGEEVVAASATSEIPVEASGNDVGSGVVVAADDEQYSVSVPSSGSMSMDPRAPPLAIQEIPLFASSKGELEDQSMV